MWRIAHKVSVAEMHWTRDSRVSGFRCSLKAALFLHAFMQKCVLVNRVYCILFFKEAGGERFATLYKIWPAWDSNNRPP